MRTLADLLDADPITLQEASDLLRGVVGVKALRAERDRGNLVTYKIGKNLFTTWGDIKEMMKRCRENPAHRGSTSDQTIERGSSETADATAELDALNLILGKLKNGSLSTSQKSTLDKRLRAASPILFPSLRS